MIKKIAIGVLAVYAVVISVLYINALQSGTFGANTTEYNVKEFLNTVTFSGSVTHSGTVTNTGYTYLKSPVLSTGVTTLTAGAATSTLTAAQICAGGGVVNWAPANNATATLPTTASLVSACLPTAGDSISVRFRNTTATGTYAIAAGTGQTLFTIYDLSTTTDATALTYTITSSTPAVLKFWLTLASSTDSTASVDFTRYKTP